jgi:two-component system chemotaxis response regulator CheB
MVGLAEELNNMNDRGAVTIAQDEASSIAYGTLGDVFKLGAATHVRPHQEIANLLATLVKNSKGASP